jgi:excisionase family DNA binding protein
MECKTCDALLAAYKQAVNLYTNAGQSFRGALGDDSRLAFKELRRLRQACKDADNALMAHLHQDHWRKGGVLGPEKEILSIKEVAEMLGCPLSHVRNLLNGKVPNVPRIPHLRSGRVRLIRRAAVLSWLESLKQATAAARAAGR